ncbi:MAG: hypothetical protein D6788_03510, partial [Planctomycetota bacterium]
FIDVCRAVQHAHQKGIIHRDIKPSNVLVCPATEAGGTDSAKRPDEASGTTSRAVVKVIDLDVAKPTQHKLTERTLFTEQGQLIGTPGYMSPEQAEMTALNVDTRTDIYSLGVLLYELLTGALPFDPSALRSAGFAEIQRIIREVDPPNPSTRLSSLGSGSGGAGKTPSPADEGRPEPASAGDGADLTVIARRRRTEPKTLIRRIRGDLDWIVMKCLEKDRTRRYETANGLALEIQRYLHQEPVLAGPPSVTYRAGKFLRRNRGPVAAVLGGVVLIGGLPLPARSLVEAEPLIAQAVERASKVLPPEHPDLALYRGTFGQVLLKLGHFEKAKNQLLQSYHVFSTMGGRKRKTREVVQSLVELYEARHAADPTGGLDGKAAEWRHRLNTLDATTQDGTEPTAAEVRPDPDKHNRADLPD